MYAKTSAGICSATGDTAFTTFDGKSFSFSDTCEYTLLVAGDTTVNQQNIHCGSGGICAKRLVVTVNALKIELLHGIDLKVGGVAMPSGFYR